MDNPEWGIAEETMHSQWCPIYRSYLQYILPDDARARDVDCRFRKELSQTLGIEYKQGLLDGHQATVERISRAFMSSNALSFGRETVEYILNREEHSLD